MTTPQLLFLAALLGATTCLANFGSELASYDFGVADLIRDDHRDRIYCSVPSKNSVVAIDVNSLAVIATIFTGSNPAGMSISPDGSELFVANSGSTHTGIAILDLEALAVSQYISTVSNVRDVAAGHGIVYSLEDEIRAYDSTTGAPFSETANNVRIYGGFIEISPDRNTLYYYVSGLSPSTWFRTDVSSWPGTMLQSGTWGSNGQDMALSADGEFITFASGAPYLIRILSANDPTISFGQMDTGAYPSGVTFGPTGNRIFAQHARGHIDVWDTKTFLKVAEIPTTGERDKLVADRNGNVLFAGDDSALGAYNIGREVAEEAPRLQIANAVELYWESQPNVSYQLEWSATPGNEAHWHPLADPIQGSGLSMSYFDQTRSTKARFYRITVVSE